ncbi:hypothetical protein H6F42_13045 [Pseudanabaena sp. FACHB-1998]|uniref:DUF5682 family protein n=1 Tax=Pseudanabaena sp. FACHB-1998 TaxID=2692858 RepID=UPI0016807E21|nr:DUF5682 family protein [Pseudanabaena sp. FACHB-1998]MBD2177841.1 hypothetical protein [Pseudanabaena sp. FACHB-1998]
MNSDRQTSNYREKVHIFGIRHHGSGSARSLCQALDQLQPDAILIEAPPDAQALLPFVMSEAMHPPVAILIYEERSPENSVYYPFAIFSPEWQAIRYGLERDIPIKFMDLPQAHRLAFKKEEQEEPKVKPESIETEPERSSQEDIQLNSETPLELNPESDLRLYRKDPLGWLAEVAGFSDGERWWEYMVEHRRDSHELFAAILEAMTALREELDAAEDFAESMGDRLIEELREAYMRQTIRTALSEGKERIAVVCGAWHAPALVNLPSTKNDANLLKGLPKVKVEATWIPWTYGRLAIASGYGAGVVSPGWYDHLWHNFQHSSSQVAIRWITRVARLLRTKDIDASSASVIEAVRLAEALSAMRDRPLAGLPELTEAIQSVLCFGDPLPMQFIHQELIVGDRMGRVPDDTPMVPLQQDLIRQQKRLRLKPEIKALELDLRNANDLERSHLLYRLALLDIPWGKTQYSNSKGTFKEPWQLQWEPEFAVRLIEAGVWGQTIIEAATAFTRDKANASKDLPTLTKLVDKVLLANLGEAASYLMVRLQAEAAIASDISHLMQAVPPLANLLRYGNVRQIDTNIVSQLMDGLITRICVGLPVACASLNDEAAAAMYELAIAVNRAILLLQNSEYAAAWHGVLSQLADQSGLHGLLGGCCCRLLLDAGIFAADDVETRMGLFLSLANEPSQAAAWVEGLLKGSGLVLLHDDCLWQVLDNWVTKLSTDTFDLVLPLLRRTFATFPAPERRQMGERVKRNQSNQIEVNSTANFSNLDLERADAILPMIAQLLGIKM